MAIRKRKYRIFDLVELHTFPSNMSEREFARRLKVPWSTYQKDKFILINDSFSLPESRLQRYAKAFGVRMEDLINYDIRQKCLIRLEDSKKDSIQRIAEEFGLSEPQKTG